MNLSYAQRLVFLAALAALGLVVIVVGLFDLQVANREMWVAALEDRSRFESIVRGERGEIRDAEGEVLARDVLGYDLMLVTAGIEGVLHECRRCGHRMSIRPDQHYSRCPRCRTTDSATAGPVLVRVDARDLGPIAELLGWSEEGLAKLVEKHVQADKDRVAKALKSAGNLGERRRRDRERYLQRKYGWLPALIKTDVSYEVAREVTLHPERNPGFRIREGRVRRNVGGIGFSQLLGRKPDRIARAGGSASGSGLELVLDSLLSGEQGEVERVRDRRGELKVARREDPIDGVSVQLTMARRDQEAGLAALDGAAGALVVVNAETGAVLTLVSSPSYEPEDFSRVWQEMKRNSVAWEEARRRAKEQGRRGPPEYARTPDPCFNRALQGWYAPGSTMKPFTALAGLRFGVVAPTDTVDCQRSFTLNGKTLSYLRCNGVHGETNLHRALVKSCNVYFQTLMHGLLSAGAGEQFEALGHAFGYGEPTGIEIESARWIRSKTFQLTPSRGRAQYGMLLQHAIGQGYITATPAQVARAYAALFTGQLPKLHLVRTRGGRPTEPERTPVGVPAPILEVVREALRANNDPGNSLAKYGLDRWELGLKTGTAQTSYQGYNTAWLAGFGEAHGNRPPIAFAMVVEYSSHHGGDECGPRLERFLRAFYAEQERPQ